MFCTSLRRRASMAATFPCLTRPPLALRENQLHTHDIEVALPTKSAAQTNTARSSRLLRLVLFSPTSVSEHKLPQTMQRIQRFAALTGGQAIAIIFLLTATKVQSVGKVVADADHHDSGGVNAVYSYSTLQAEMISLVDLPYIPILPLHDVEALQQLINRHVGILSRGPLQAKPSATPLNLLRMCTVNPPMSQSMAYMISDCFPNLRELALACTTYSVDPRVDMGGINDRLRGIRELLGEHKFCDLIHFWKNEYIAE